MLARDAGGGGRGVGADPRGDPRVLQAGRAADRPVRCEPYLLVAGAAVVRRAAIPCRGCRDTGERNAAGAARSEEHTSELQSLMRNSYAVFCLTKKLKYLRYDNTRRKISSTQQNNYTQLKLN